MNAFCKQAVKNRNRIEREEAARRHKEMLDSMTPEERAAYDKEREKSAERGKQALMNLAAMQSMFKGPYSNL